MDLRVKAEEAKLIRLQHQVNVLLRRANTKANKIKKLSQKCNHMIGVNFEKEGKTVCLFCGKNFSKKAGDFVIPADKIGTSDMTEKEKLSFIRTEYYKMLQRGEYNESLEGMYLNLKEKLGLKRV